MTKKRIEVNEFPYQCDECGEEITVEKRNKGVGLVMTCACDVAQSIRTNSTLPEEWSV